jgi:hypothetical protein
VQTRFIAGVAAAAVALSSARARADGLSPGETDRLLSGATVARPQSLDRNRKHYVGGVAYSIVDAPADRVAAELANVDGWLRFLPRTRSARPVGSVSGDALVEVTHGSLLVHATYTVRVRREGRAVRFWMDSQRPHDIEDAWGFLRAEPLPDGRSLVTFAVLIDMGPGLLRDLFESRVRELALSVPDRVRGWVVERKGIGPRASR